MARRQKTPVIQSDEQNRQVARQVIAYIEQNGPDYQALSDLFDVCLIERQKYRLTFDKDYWLGVTRRLKPWIMDCHIATGDDKFGTLLDRVFLYEAPYLFSSYMLYLEKDRNPEDRFYEPRMRAFNKMGIIKAMQDLEDDKLKLLSISLCPGSGKSQPLDSHILTPSGWKLMGDIREGDKVISRHGDVTRVLGVFPQGVLPVYRVTLDNGASCECSMNHLWSVQLVKDDSCNGETVTSLERICDMMRKGYAAYIPMQEGYFEAKIASVEYTRDAECQCIYVNHWSHLYVTDDHILTHNTTLEKFFVSWVMGRHPRDYNLFFSHSADITDMFYRGVLDIIANPDYNWQQIFPEAHLYKTNAKKQEILINNYRPFANLQCTSIGAGNAGKVRANRYLLCDDLIPGIEVAMNKNQLDKLWGIYTADARQRKLNSDVKEIHIATRWSVHDVIGRLKLMYDGQPGYKFIAVPDIDPQTGESNFLYDYNGMTVEFFRDQELLMDEITYRCLYKNEPIEREGLLYHEDELRRYDVLPGQEPDAILGICDTKSTGIDYMFLPVAYQYGDDFYIDDCICDNTADFNVQYRRLTEIILKHNMQQCEFESNAGGDRIAFEVGTRVQEAKGRCNITTKPTETNKETRIIVNSDWVKKHCLFKMKELYSSKSDYGKMMSFLLSYSVAGKNVNDDVPDGFANLALFIQKKERIRPTFIITGGMWGKR